MTTLRILADDAIDHLSSVIDDLQLLVDVSIAAAVNNTLFDNFSHVSLLILDMHCGPIIEA